MGENKDLNIFNIFIKDGIQLFVKHDLRLFKNVKSLEPLYMMVGMVEKFKQQILDRVEYIETGEEMGEDLDFDEDITGLFGDGNDNWNLD